MLRHTTKLKVITSGRSLVAWLILGVAITACQKKKSDDEASDLTGDDTTVRPVFASGAKQPISGAPTVTVITGIDGTPVVTLGGDVTAPAPGATGLLASIDVTFTSLSVKWSAATDDRAAPGELLYQVYRSTAANLVTVADCLKNGTPLLGAPTASQTSLAQTGLTPATKYYYNVVVTDPDGNAAVYAMLSTGTITDIAAPVSGGAAGATANPAISATVTSTSAALSWIKATDDHWPATSLSYRVFYSMNAAMNDVDDMELANGTPAVLVTAGGAYAADSSAATLTGLTPGTTYYANVVVKDASGNRATYSRVTITTPTIPNSPATSLVKIAGDATTIVSGASIVIQLQAKDAAGADLAQGSGTVAFTVSGGTSTFAGTSPIAAVNDGSGIYTATLTGVLAGTAATIGATIDGVAVASTKTLVVTPGIIRTATSAVSIVGGATTVANGSSVSVKLQAKDAAGNNLSTGGSAVAFTTTGGTSTFTQSFPVAAVDNGDGTYTASFSGNVPGTSATIGATIGGVAATSTTSLRVLSGTIAASTSTVSIVSGATSVTSASSVVIRLQAKDASGNNLTTGGASVTFTKSGGTASFTQTFPVTATDNGDGTYTATLTGSLAGSAPTLGAKIGTTQVNSTTGVAVTPSTISPTASTVTFVGAPASVASGANVTVRLQAKDAAGNDLTTGGATVTFTQTGGTSTFTQTLPLAATDNLDGTYTATLTGSVAGTAKTIGAKIGTTVVTSTADMTVTSGSAATGTSVVSILSGATTVASGSTVTLKLQAKDAAGNSLTSGGSTVTFTLGAGASTSLHPWKVVAV